MSTKTKTKTKTERLSDGRKVIPMESTELWNEPVNGAANQAETLWADGWRPIEARKLRVGDRVMARQTMFGFGTGSAFVATVLGIESPDDWTVIVDLTTGQADSDSESEVWMKVAR
jgi:hypothetical protein